MPVPIALARTAYLAPEGFVAGLVAELGDVAAVHGRLVLGPARPVAWVRNVRRYETRLLELADPVTARRLMQAVGDRWPDQRAEVETAPTRVLANAIVNTCWRNGPVEQIHAGRAGAYPLRERRIRPAEERHLMGYAGRPARARMACREHGRPGRVDFTRGAGCAW